MMDPVVPTEDVPVESEEQRKAKMHMHTELQAQAERAKAVQKSECKESAAASSVPSSELSLVVTKGCVTCGACLAQQGGADDAHHLKTFGHEHRSGRHSAHRIVREEKREEEGSPRRKDRAASPGTTNSHNKKTPPADLKTL